VARSATQVSTNELDMARACQFHVRKSRHRRPQFAIRHFHSGDLLAMQTTGAQLGTSPVHIMLAHGVISRIGERQTVMTGATSATRCSIC